MPELSSTRRGLARAREHRRQRPRRKLLFISKKQVYWVFATHDGRWLKETVLPPGTYEYCLVVDGEWMPDPRARESVPNLFGGRDSLLKVASSPEAAHLADAEHLPLKNANK